MAHVVRGLCAALSVIKTILVGSLLGALARETSLKHRAIVDWSLATTLQSLQKL